MISLSSWRITPLQLDALVSLSYLSNRPISQSWAEYLKSYTLPSDILNLVWICACIWVINTLSELRAKETELDKTRVTGCLDPLTKTLLNFDDAEDLHRYTSVCSSANSTFLLVYSHTQTGTFLLSKNWCLTLSTPWLQEHKRYLSSLGLRWFWRSVPRVCFVSARCKHGMKWSICVGMKTRNMNRWSPIPPFPRPPSLSSSFFVALFCLSWSPFSIEFRFDLRGVSYWTEVPQVWHKF
jgi:hypothetical protein